LLPVRNKRTVSIGFRAEVLIFAGDLTGGGSFADIRGIYGEFAVRMRATGFRYRFFGIHFAPYY